MAKEVNEFEVSKKEVQHHINAILEWIAKGAKKELKFRQLSPNWMYRTIEFIKGTEILEGFHTNGWEGDYWQNWTYKGEEYTMAGSAHYGYASVYRADRD